jgi:Domain of unknown function (DUF4281)
MQLEMIYLGCTVLAMIGWAGLALSPLDRGYCIWFARGIALVLGLAYSAQLFLITEPTGGDFNTLYGVTTLFSKAGNVMLGWTHYLAFDLFMGSWEVEDAQRVGVPHWLVVPCLALTFVLGPVGLVTYFIIRTVKIKMTAPA